MSELMQAVVLLAHFHSLASFILGCGVNSEIDHPDGYTYTDGEASTDGNHVERTNGQRVVTSHPHSVKFCLLICEVVLYHIW
jgi:PA26 p53-induced protein (sestrin)